jgi:hypothetical protein
MKSAAGEGLVETSAKQLTDFRNRLINLILVNSLSWSTVDLGLHKEELFYCLTVTKMRNLEPVKNRY